LFAAAFVGNANVVVLLLGDPRVDPNICTIHGSSPFYIAASQGRVEVVKVMLRDLRVNINLANVENITPLWGACLQNSITVVRWILASSRELDTKTRAQKDSVVTEVLQAQRLRHAELLDAFEENPEEVRASLRQKLGIVSDSGDGNAVGSSENNEMEDCSPDTSANLPPRLQQQQPFPPENNHFALLQDSGMWASADETFLPTSTNSNNILGLNRQQQQQLQNQLQEPSLLPMPSFLDMHEVKKLQDELREKTVLLFSKEHEIQSLKAQVRALEEESAAKDQSTRVLLDQLAQNETNFKMLEGQIHAKNGLIAMLQAKMK